MRLIFLSAWSAEPVVHFMTIRPDGQAPWFVAGEPLIHLFISFQHYWTNSK